MTDDMQREALSASEALAHLYVWDTVATILEGSSTPDRQDAKSSRAVDRVIAIAKNEARRCLRIHEKHMAAIRHMRENGKEGAPNA